MSEIDRVRQGLLTRKGQWRRIALESGVAHRAIYNVVYEKNDPRTSTIQALAKWLRDAELAEGQQEQPPDPGPLRPNLPQSGNGRRGRSATPTESEPSLAPSTSAA